MTKDPITKTQSMPTNTVTEAITSLVKPPKSALDKTNDPIFPEEIGGASGPEPTRYGDWEKNGRCVDF